MLACFLTGHLPLETATIPVTCDGYNVRFLGGSVYKRIAAEFSGQITG